MQIDYSMLPEHMRHGMKLWIEHAIWPGSFLTALLCNDFIYAHSLADSTNIDKLHLFAEFLRREAPVGSYGSDEICAAWKGLEMERGKVWPALRMVK
jgi:hypothetical protein